MISSARVPRRVKDLIKSFLKPHVPKHLLSRFKSIDKQGMDTIAASLKHNYFSPQDAWFDDTYLTTEEGGKDFQDHHSKRLEEFRSTLIPWLDRANHLAGKNILEIGCGTGSSTIALAEQGARVTALDVVDSSLTVARDRCRVYGLDASFENANATEVKNLFAEQEFDFIIFFAALEHMTHDERIIAMRDTWDMLPPGGLWCVVETPNRLWFYDSHTSWLPFFMWLPDDLAFKYSQFSPRKPFHDLYREIDDQSMLDFLRRGRGVSFHEFELTMKRAEELDVVDSLPMFLRRQSLLRKMLWKL